MYEDLLREDREDQQQREPEQYSERESNARELYGEPQGGPYFDEWIEQDIRMAEQW